MRVIAAHKSINLLQITFRGRAAHSSLTPQGVNAIEYASRLVVFVRSIADEFKANGPYDEHVRRAVHDGQREPRRRRDRRQHRARPVHRAA